MATNTVQSASLGGQRASVSTVQEGTQETQNVLHSVTLNVAGQRFTIRTDQDPEYLAGLAEDVTQIVNALRQSAPGCGLPKLMALVAIQLADRACVAEQALEKESLKIEKHIERLSGILNSLDQTDGSF